MRDLRILVVADDPLARAGLGALLSSHVGYTVVGQTPADEELLRAVDVYRPDVLLWTWDRTPSQASSSWQTLTKQVCG